MNNIFLVAIGFVYCVGVLAVDGDKYDCDDLKVLARNSPDLDWFSWSYDPPVQREEKHLRPLWGYGWNNGERSFHGPYEENQSITIKAADDSAFILEILSIKTTNTDFIKFIATYPDQTTEVLDIKTPRSIVGVWQKASVKAKGKGPMIAVTMVIDLSEEIIEDKIDRRHRLYIRGMKMKVCPV